MSLFASLGQGDFWSSGFTYTSPINDTLEKESFTLEDLLEEDELLQEVKARNTRLIEFLSQESQVDKLLSYVVEAPVEGSNDLRMFKFPYMSCEVVCCEVPDILQILVDEHDGKYLNKLFSILDVPNTVNHFLAGYFEKILEVIFRRKTIQVMTFLNAQGQELLAKFLRHIDNYSIMQIVQRLMLPHIPFTIDTADPEAVAPEDRDNCQCNWSFQPHTCDMLTSRMLDGYGPDVPYHVSDLLITVVQLSSPDAPFIAHLCQQSNLHQLLGAAFQTLETNTQPPNTDTDTATESQAQVASDVSLASICVLESLISRLCENGNPFDAAGNAEAGQERSSAQAAAIDAVSTELVAHVPQLASQLSSYVTRNPAGEIVIQTHQSIPRLGQRGLQLVKLVEACVRLGLPALDQSLRESGTLKSCLDMFFKFELNSLLHLSVQRIVLMILEGGQHRREQQRYLIAECELLRRMVHAMTTKTDNPELLSKSRRPLIGHLIVITQVIVSVVHSESNDETQSNSAPNPVTGTEIADGASETAASGSSLKEIIQDTGLLGDWNEFVMGEFTEIMTAQTAFLGNAEYPNRHEEQQIGVGMDIGGTDKSGGLAELEAAMIQLSVHASAVTQQPDWATLSSREWLPTTETDVDGDLLAVNAARGVGVPSNGAQDESHEGFGSASHSNNLFFAAFEPSEAGGFGSGFSDAANPTNPNPNPNPNTNPFGFADFAAFETEATAAPTFSLADASSDSDDEEQT